MCSKRNEKTVEQNVQIGGDFILIDQDGKLFNSNSLKGKLTLVYFGFTYCPAICPTELQKITTAYSTLPKDAQDKIQLYFVSIDPERDTQEIMKNYMALFDPKWMGLRGTEAQTEAVKKAYKIYAAKIPQGDSYTMDHSTFIYVMGPDGTLKHMFRNTDNANVMAATLKNLTK